MKTADIFYMLYVELGENVQNFVVDIKDCKSITFSSANSTVTVTYPHKIWTNLHKVAEKLT